MIMFYLVQSRTMYENQKRLQKQSDKKKIRFYYMKQDELIGCEVESIEYRDQLEFTIQEEDYK